MDGISSESFSKISGNAPSRGFHQDDRNGGEVFRIHQCPNGLTLLGQPMPDVSSAAMTIAVRCGSAHDPDGAEGAAAVAAEWLLRGAADRDSRALNDALDALGVQHSESVHSEHIHLSAAMLGRNLPAVLDLYADILQAPRLGDDAFEPCRALIRQDLQSLDDEPARKCNYLLREKFFPYPLGRLIYGKPESLEAMTPAGLREHVRRYFTPAETVLAVAGAFEWEPFVDLVEKRLGGWSGPAQPAPTIQPAAGGTTHIEKDTAQTHIALAYKAPTCDEADYYPIRLAETVLSRGMGSRLFTEVREKRGLVYHISAGYLCLKDHAGMFVYAGSRPDLAQQTFDVTLAELHRLGKDVTPEELDRAKTQLRSALVMQGASTTSRSGTLASDWYHLGRLRTLAEVSRCVQAVTRQDILRSLEKYPARDLTLLTVGPASLRKDS
ncbi:MAG: insulinase family protein [Phycisphaerae bacterium]|nr:insulinase family protein [Phycisphaerae bacterium]